MTEPTYNTNDLKITQFDAHGSLNQQVEGRVLRTRARGPFNAEMLKVTAAIQLPLFAEMSSGGKWVEILEFSNSALATADALALFAPYLQESKAAGIAPVATAIVLGDRLEGAAIMRERYAAAYASAHWPCAFFATIPEAEAWARQMLSPANAA